MTAYYNEHDPYAAQWLRNLIDAAHIAWCNLLLDSLTGQPHRSPGNYN